MWEWHHFRPEYHLATLHPREAKVGAGLKWHHEMTCSWASRFLRSWGIIAAHGECRHRSDKNADTTMTWCHKVAQERARAYARCCWKGPQPGMSLHNMVLWYDMIEGACLKYSYKWPWPSMSMTVNAPCPCEGTQLPMDLTGHWERGQRAWLSDLPLLRALPALSLPAWNLVSWGMGWEVIIMCVGLTGHCEMTLLESRCLNHYYHTEMQ